MKADDLCWLDVCAFDDIPRAGARRLFVGERQIAVFRTAEDGLFALEDRCPHAGGPLSDGIVHGDCVTCPLHNWVISLRDGQAQGADCGNVTIWLVRVIGQRVQLLRSAEQQRLSQCA